MSDLGSDFAGVNDLTFALSVVTGRRALAEAILRRLRTRRGSLWTDPSYGFDLRGVIGTALTNSQISQRVTAQVLAEEEVESARVNVSRIGEEIQVEIEVTDADGPFDFTITANSLTVDVIQGRV